MLSKCRSQPIRGRDRCSHFSLLFSEMLSCSRINFAPFKLMSSTCFLFLISSWVISNIKLVSFVFLTFFRSGFGLEKIFQKKILNNKGRDVGHLPVNFIFYCS